VAAELKKSLGVTSNLVEGDRGEFTVWVGSAKVAEKENGEFPAERSVVEAVEAALKT
jgi:hypothetical protein